MDVYCSRKEYYLGGIIALLLLDHRTMSTKSVCSTERRARRYKTHYIVRSHQGMTTGAERSSVLGGRRKEKARSERVVVEHSKPVWQPLGMTDSTIT